MARLRTLKPSFFTNDILAEVDPLGRLLFQGLWCIADREGRLEDRPKRIKAEVLPYDTCNVDALLDDLARLGFIVRYAVAEQRYIQVTNFGKHQTPHIKEAASTIPAPDKHGASTVRHTPQESASTPSYLDPDPVVGSSSGNLDTDRPPLPPKGGGKRTKAKTTIPDDFAITDEMRAWADEKAPGVDIDVETERFLDRNRREGSTYADWPAAWRYWMTTDYPKAMKGNVHAIDTRRSGQAGRQAGYGHRRLKVGAAGSHGPGGYDSWADKD